MKPSKLVIEGINSFRERQEIDFEKLMQSRLFGIFGNTGSGKSSILDGITLALYGRMNRTSDKSDFVNSMMLSGMVDYSFSIRLNGKDCKYRVKRIFSLKPTRESKDAKAELYEITPQGEVMIEKDVSRVNAKLNEIIGLTFDEFKKCVALPQGEFATFIKSSRGERIGLIGKLFDLSKYGSDGIYKKVRRRMEELSGNVSVLQGKIETFLDASEESLNSLKEENNKITKELERISKEIKEKEGYITDNRVLFDKYNEKEKLEREEKNLLSLKEEIENKKQAIERSDKSKEVLQIYEKKENNDKTKKENELKIKDLDAKVLEIDDFLAKFENEDKKNNQRLLNISADIKVLETLISTEKEREELSAKRLSKLDEYKRVEKEKKDSEAELVNVKKILLSSENIEKEIRDKLDEILRRKKRELLGEFIEGERSYFIEQKEKTLEYKSKNEKEKFPDLVLDEIEKKLQSLSLPSFDAKEIKESEEKLKKELEKVTGEISDYRKKESELLQTFASLTTRLNHLLEEGKELKSSIDGMNEKLSAYLKDGESVAIKIQKLESERKSLEKQIKENVERANGSQKQKGDCEKEKVRLETINFSIEKENELLKADLENKMTSFGFTSIEKVRVAYLGEKREIFARQVESYENKALINKSSLTEITNLLDSKAFNLVQFKEVDLSLKEIKTKKENYDKTEATFKEKLTTLESRLKEKLDLEKEVSKLKNELDKVGVLFDLVKNNNFLEYIANEYLAEVSYSATDILVKLTSGRYTLLYEDEFYVRDNAFGGEVRSVDTLSGGEVFLVSLSLAVALSTMIYQKSNRPIEFFFLDEGFGSLDGELVDTVIGSLESLKDTHFPIGLISHVEELKQRIQSKIIVKGSSVERGSTITIAEG